MAYGDPEREKAYQEQYRKANAERRKEYDRERYYLYTKPQRQEASAEKRITKPKRLKARAASKDHRPGKEA